MGLDIYTVKNAKLVKEEPKDGFEDRDWDLLDSDDYHRIYLNPHFPAHMDGKPAGLYKGEHGISFRAGSYSGYNAWREHLSEALLGANPHVVWDNIGDYRDKPFIEIVHFSDCEGAIASDTSLKLYGDFVAHNGDFHSSLGDLDPYTAQWFGRVYDDFQQAFEEAAEDGFVVFS